MTTRINLLPHREERRKAARKHFAVVAAMTAVLGGAIVLLVHGFYATQVNEQTLTFVPKVVVTLSVFGWFFPAWMGALVDFMRSLMATAGGLR